MLGYMGCFCKHIDWFSETDIEGILIKMEEHDYSFYRKSDQTWLSKLKDCKNITTSQKTRIDNMANI